jgi:hypothetical protein
VERIPMMDAYVRLLPRIGDGVTLRQSRPGTVVGVIERGEFAAGLDASRRKDLFHGRIVLCGDGL